MALCVLVFGITETIADDEPCTPVTSSECQEIMCDVPMCPKGWSIDYNNPCSCCPGCKKDKCK